MLPPLAQLLTGSVNGHREGARMEQLKHIGYVAALTIIFVVASYIVLVVSFD
jgi:hypothetical protein